MALPSRTRPEKIRLATINPYLTCYLCKGYYIDATTISECLHSFCRSCIIPFLHERSYCPICEVIINKAKPNLKLDKTLQDIVYKLVPELFLREMARRQRFYRERPQLAARVTPEERGADTERTIFNPRDSISLSMEYISDDSSSSASNIFEKTARDDPTALRRFLQCPGMCRVEVLKKFIQNKYNVDTSSFYIDILYKRVPLPDHYTLIDIAYIYSWKRNEPMKFYFKITDIDLVTDTYDYLIQAAAKTTPTATVAPSTPAPPITAAIVKCAPPHHDDVVAVPKARKTIRSKRRLTHDWPLNGKETLKDGADASKDGADAESGRVQTKSDDTSEAKVSNRLRDVRKSVPSPPEGAVKAGTRAPSLNGERPTTKTAPAHHRVTFSDAPPSTTPAASPPRTKTPESILKSPKTDESPPQRSRTLLDEAFDRLLAETVSSNRVVCDTKTKDAKSPERSLAPPVSAPVHVSARAPKCLPLRSPPPAAQTPVRPPPPPVNNKNNNHDDVEVIKKVSNRDGMAIGYKIERVSKVVTSPVMAAPVTVTAASNGQQVAATACDLEVAKWNFLKAFDLQAKVLCGTTTPPEKDKGGEGKKKVGDEKEVRAQRPTDSKEPTTPQKRKNPNPMRVSKKARVLSNPQIKQMLTNVQQSASHVSKIVGQSVPTTIDLKSLFDNYKINIPSSLSVTVKTEKDETSMPSVMQKPVQNYIEILKINHVTKNNTIQLFN